MSNSEFIYGYHAIKALLEVQPAQITTLYLQEKRQDERLEALLARAQTLDVRVERLTRSALDALIGEPVTHQGMVAQVEGFSGFDESALPALLENSAQPALLLILDGVQDPHNLGACLRSANVFGVDAVIVPKNRAVGMTPVVRKVACGASAMTPFVCVTNLARTMRDLQDRGVWMVGMMAEAEKPLREVDLQGDIAIVLGSEGEGLRRLTLEHCDFPAKIPMQGMVESLNVSVATGICLYEVQRQRTSLT